MDFSIGKKFVLETWYTPWFGQLKHLKINLGDQLVHVLNGLTWNLTFQTSLTSWTIAALGLVTIITVITVIFLITTQTSW